MTRNQSVINRLLLSKVPEPYRHPQFQTEYHQKHDIDNRRQANASLPYLDADQLIFSILGDESFVSTSRYNVDFGGISIPYDGVKGSQNQLLRI